MVGLCMETRNRTKTSVLSALGFIYATSVLVFLLLVPFHISSSNICSRYTTGKLVGSRTRLRTHQMR